ncbi:MAG TPA: hypothetical protein DEF51_15885 [Myxococcales bacterium]|nr:hypothetical protein [Myxococcales bacterium]
MTARRPFDRPNAARRALDLMIARNGGLGDYLRDLARASVCAAVMAGCGMSHGGTDGGPVADSGSGDGGTVTDSGTDAGPPPPPPPPATLCAGDVYQAVHGLTPTESPTYLGAWTVGLGRSPIYALDEIGEACGDASDRAGCDAELQRAQEETWQNALISTTGDDVVVRTDPADVLAFLGTIDTPNEAALVVWHAGYEIYCAGPHLSSVETLPDGFRVYAYQAGGGCGEPWVTTRFTFHVSPAGEMTLEDEREVAREEDFGCIGRRPEGLQAATGERATLGQYFAHVARLEASAVAAFDVMIDELSRLGAPEGLLDAAREAREDEVRHAASMGEVACSYGATPLRPDIAPARERSAFEIALENAVEGCVRETFGALVGAHQALAAEDPAIAAAMRGVADDEIRHAELSWSVAAWLEPQLSPSERARIDQARRDAIVALRHQASGEPDPDLRRLAGMPSAAQAVRFVDHLANDLWA